DHLRRYQRVYGRSARGPDSRFRVGIVQVCGHNECRPAARHHGEKDSRRWIETADDECSEGIQTAVRCITERGDGGGKVKRALGSRIKTNSWQTFSTFGGAFVA